MEKVHFHIIGREINNSFGGRHDNDPICVGVDIAFQHIHSPLSAKYPGRWFSNRKTFDQHQKMAIRHS